MLTPLELTDAFENLPTCVSPTLGHRVNSFVSTKVTMNQVYVNAVLYVKDVYACSRAQGLMWLEDRGRAGTWP